MSAASPSRFPAERHVSRLAARAPPTRAGRQEVKAIERRRRSSRRLIGSPSRVGKPRNLHFVVPPNAGTHTPRPSISGSGS